MSIKDKLKEFPLWLFLIRGFAIYFIVLAIKSILGFRVMTTYTGMQLGSYSNGTIIMPDFAVALIYLVGTFFLFNSTLNIFCSYDRRRMEMLLAKGVTRVGLFESFWRSLRSAEYWCEMAPLMFFTVIGALVGWYPEVTYSFAETGVSQGFLDVLPLLFMTTVTLLLTLWRRYEAERYWLYLQRRDNLDRLYRHRRLILRAVMLPIIYIIFYPFAPMAGMIFFALPAFLIMLVDFLSLLGFVVALFALIALIYGLSVLHAVKVRKRIVKKLPQLCEENGYTLSEIKRPYASLFSPKNECNFTVEKDGKLFSCHLVGSPWQKAPIFFVSSTTAYFKHKIGTKNHHITFLSTFEYNFEGEGEKIIIVNPVPKHIYVSQDEMLTGETDETAARYQTEGRLSSVATLSPIRRREAKSTRELQPGDKIWGYTIYNTTSFLGAIDRKCLGRSNGFFD